MKRLIWNAIGVVTILGIVSIAYLSTRIEQQSTRDEAQNADVILVLGAAEYRGRPSPGYHPCQQRLLRKLRLAWW